MMAILMPNGKVVFADKIENYTELILPNGQFAYSSEYDPVTNEVVALEYKVCPGSRIFQFHTNNCTDECILCWWNRSS